MSCAFSALLCGACACARHLLAQRHAAAQRAGEADDFGHKGLEGEVFFEHHSPQDGLHLWDARTWYRKDNDLVKLDLRHVILRLLRLHSNDSNLSIFG